MTCAMRSQKGFKTFSKRLCHSEVSNTQLSDCWWWPLPLCQYGCENFKYFCSIWLPDIHTCTYMHIHAYTCIYIHIRTYTYIYIYTCIYVHILIPPNRGLEMLSRGGGRRSQAAGWSHTHQISCDGPWDWINERR